MDKSRMLLSRKAHLHEISLAFEVHPIVAILGPRQCGKTTSAREYIYSLGEIPAENYFDLEDPQDIARLSDPKLTLQSLSGLIVIDEIQRVPALFPILRVIIDSHKEKQRYLILGSASAHLLKQSSESLAGRVEYLYLSPLNLSEVDDMKKLWTRGGFPNAYLAKSEETSYRWRTAYIRTFLEQDIPNLGINIPSQHLYRFWMMLAHYHGNLCNYNEMAKSLGISHTTARTYCDILMGTFMIRQLQPWHENISKRQVKSHKIYFRDSGLYHTLLQINDPAQLQLHPKLGASWEGFALEEIIRYFRLPDNAVYFWATHNDAELDLLIFHEGKRLGFEFKYQSSPSSTRAMQIAIENLQLDALTIVYPGIKSYPLTEKIKVQALSDFINKSDS